MLFICLLDCKLDVVCMLDSFAHLTVFLGFLSVVVLMEVMHSFYLIILINLYFYFIFKLK